VKAGLFSILWLVCHCALAAGRPWPEVWPRTGQLEFEVRQVSSGLVIGRNEHRWDHDGKTWRLNSVTEPAGIASLFSDARAEQESQGIFVDAGLQPLEFRTARSGKARDSARFDIAAGRLVLGNGETHAFRVPAQDLLSLFYQLGVHAPDRFPATLLATTGRKLAEYALTPGAIEPLATGIGPRRARHVGIVPRGKPESEERTDVWIDAATRLPIKIRYRDRKGGLFEQVLVQWRIGGAP